MLKSIYTNTSNPKAIVGLLVVTVGVAYCQQNATQIVDGAMRLIRNGKRDVESKLHRSKKQYAVCGRDFDGNMYDTGDRVWK